MKSPPPLSPYGVFSGQLFQYSVNPSLIAFESSPPSSLAHLDIQSSAITASSSPSQAVHPTSGNDCNSNNRRKCILLGGLSDGPIPTPYTKLLETKCHSLGWSLVQPILSSSYLGFGHGSLSRDTDELELLLEYLVCHHSASRFAFVGHSTGCQNSIHMLRHGRKDLVERVKAVALQAPVSDRESITITPGNTSMHHLSHARTLHDQDKGEEMMPRSAFWAPITASRYLSLFDVNGDDDFFSSDLTDDELHNRLGHVAKLGMETGLHVLVAFSKQDEYVPKSVDASNLLKRLVAAMNGYPANKEGASCVESAAVAHGLMLENANHNLSNNEWDKELFVETFGALLT